MRRIAHISDLHFGTETADVAEGLRVDLAEFDPHLLAVSGDLTQRARRRQFQAASAYLDRIAAPKVIVPGNHDIPLYNVVARFLYPLAGYRKHITKDLFPMYVDDELAVIGVNTARSFSWKEGRISLEQIARLKVEFCGLPDRLHKVLVAHHPFIPPRHDERAGLVGRVGLALQSLEACGCSLVLAGHLHLAYSGDVRPYHVEIKRSILVAQAATAISHRRRDEPNGYNRIVFDGDHLRFDVRAWDGARFTSAGASVYEKQGDQWVVKKS